MVVFAQSLGSVPLQHKLIHAMHLTGIDATHSGDVQRGGSGAVLSQEIRRATAIELPNIEGDGSRL